MTNKQFYLGNNISSGAAKRLAIAYGDWLSNDWNRIKYIYQKEEELFELFLDADYSEKEKPHVVNSFEDLKSGDFVRLIKFPFVESKDFLTIGKEYLITDIYPQTKVDGAYFALIRVVTDGNHLKLYVLRKECWEIVN